MPTRALISCPKKHERASLIIRTTSSPSSAGVRPPDFTCHQLEIISAMDSEEPEKATGRIESLRIRTGRKKRSSSSGQSGEAEPTTEAAVKAAAAANDRKEEEEEEPVSPTGRLFHQPGFNCYIVTALGLGKPIDLDVMRAGLDETFARHPRFCSIPAMSSKTPTWVKTKVVVKDHMVIPELDPAKVSASPDRAVEDYISSITSPGNAMDFSRPLWDIHFLDFPTSSAAATIVLRFHHSLGDGISLISFFLACTRKTSDPKALPTLPRSHRPPAVQKRSWSFLFLWVWSLLVLLWNTVIDVVHFVASSMFLRDTPTPLMGAEGVEFRQKRIVYRTMDERIASVDDIKEIKNAIHGTLNDALLGITLAALTRYLERKYGECDDTKEEEEKKKDKYLPANIRLRATLLVNIRPAAGIQAISELIGGKRVGLQLGNLLGYMLFPFPIAKLEDPLDYIRKGKEVADRKKKSLEALLTYKCADLIFKYFGIKVANKLNHRVLSNTTLSFSNVVGPEDEVSFYGHPIVYIAPTVYGHPQALTIHFQSYMNKMTIVLSVDESTIRDPHKLLDDMTESLILIKEAIPNKS